MIYQSMKLTNGEWIHCKQTQKYNSHNLNPGIWGLMEIKLAPDNPNIILSFKSRVMEVAQPIFQVCVKETIVIDLKCNCNIVGL